jgi:hypothetical protein
MAGDFLILSDGTGNYELEETASPRIPPKLQFLCRWPGG